MKRLSFVAAITLSTLSVALPAQAERWVKISDYSRNDGGEIALYINVGSIWRQGGRAGAEFHFYKEQANGEQQRYYAVADFECLKRQMRVRKVDGESFNKPWLRVAPESNGETMLASACYGQF